MAYDGFVLKYALEALTPILHNRVDKIDQPENDQILMTFRNKSRLKFSINPSMPYLTLTTLKRPNSPTPSLFLIMLRKHLKGALLLGIEQLGEDRQVRFNFLSRNELGDETPLVLVLELMGKHSNLILLDEADIIIDALKRVPPYMSPSRPILPTLGYQAMTSDQLSVLAVSLEDFKTRMQAKDQPVAKALYRNFQGFSPGLATFISQNSGVDPSGPSGALSGDQVKALYLACRNFQPEGFYIFTDEGGQFKDFHLVPLGTTPHLKSYATIFEMIEAFFTTKDQQVHILQRSKSMRKTIEGRIKRTQGKIESLKAELTLSEAADDLKIMAELLLANIHQLKKGLTSVTLTNYYTDEPLTIPLDPRLGPQENISACYKKYHKLKGSKAHLLPQISRAEEEIEYLEASLVSIETAGGAEDLLAVAEELSQEGYLKKRGYTKKKKTPPGYHRYLSETGFEILVGKNNKANDELTFKVASKQDLWFHTRGIPGSHVVLRLKGLEPDEATLVLAATIAAFYSKAGLSENVPVDYTTVRQVKKPSGAKPGFVNYFEQKTLYVTPGEETLKGRKT